MSEPASDDLRSQAVTGLGWRGVTVVFKVIFQFGVGVVLARLLPPEDFGLVGLAMIVIGLGEMFADLGVGPALIQRKNITQAHVRTGFTVSVVVSLLLTSSVWVGAPLIADLLGDERLTAVLGFLSLVFLFNGFGVAARSLLQRDLNFRYVMWVDVSSYLLGYASVGVALAMWDYGVWSLVWASLAQSFLSTILAYLLTLHTVRPLLRRKEIAELGSFGFGVSMERLVNYFALQGDYIVTGRILGAHALGLYTRAYNLMKMPLTHFVRVIADVMFPAASQIQNQQHRMRRVYVRTIGVIAFVTLPVMTGVLVLAPQFIVGVFGEKWEDAVVPLQILSLSGFGRAVYHGASIFVKARGRIYPLVMCQVVYALAVLSGAYAGAGLWGINGVAVAVALAIFLMFGLTLYLANRVTNTPLRQIVRSVQPGAVLASIIGISVFGVQWLGVQWKLGNLPILALGIACGVAVIPVVLRVLPVRLFGEVPSTILSVLDGRIGEWGRARLQWAYDRFR
jgi:PST family polysaccharide transporter